jgi:MFS family permease
MTLLPHRAVPDNGQKQTERPIVMPMPSRDVLVLAAGQALTSTVVSLLTSVSSLSGAYLAPAPALSTAPVTATVLGTLVMIYPASALMGRLGRRGGFMFKAGIGAIGGAVCALALLADSFVTLIAGTFLLGIFSAFGQYYRFAAIDAARSVQQRTAAVAVVTGAGALGGVAGPFLGGAFGGVMRAVPYVGAFAALSVVCAALAASQLLLSTDLGRDGRRETGAGSALSFTLNAGFIRASAICAAGFAVMTLTMNAAPLSLHLCGYSLPVSAAVLQVHFALMYLPSLLNPVLVAAIGLRGLVALGVAASGAGCLLTVLTAQTLGIYVVELGLSGLGWNFMFNGGTLLLANTYPASRRTRAQGLNSLFVYGANLAASFSAGTLMAAYGWPIVNVACLPLLAVALAALWPARSTKAALASGAIKRA